MVMSLTFAAPQALALKQLKSNAVSRRTSIAAPRRSVSVVRMQASVATAPPASGEIKDKKAELAINGT